MIQRAVPDKAVLLIVGDIDRLPSVGPSGAGRYHGLGCRARRAANRGHPPSGANARISARRRLVTIGNDRIDTRPQLLRALTMPASLPHIKAGKLRALAVTSAERVAVLPNVPTASETVPGFVIGGWWGIGAPAGTPQAIVERLNKEVNAALTDPKIKARLGELSAIPQLVSPAEYRKFIESETERWGKVVKAAGVTVE